MTRYPFNVSASVHYFRGMHCLYHTLTSRFALDASMKLLILSFFPHPNYYQKTLLIRQSLVCLCYPYVYDQATYGINHTELCSVCRCLWSRRFSKISHSLRSCGIFKKPLDHKYLHTSIVQYCLIPVTSQNLSSKYIIGKKAALITGINFAWLRTH